MPDLTRYAKAVMLNMRESGLDMNPFFEQYAASKKAEATCAYCGTYPQKDSRCKNCGGPREPR